VNGAWAGGATLAKPHRPERAGAGSCPSNPPAHPPTLRSPPPKPVDNHPLIRSPHPLTPPHSPTRPTSACLPRPPALCYPRAQHVSTCFSYQPRIHSRRFALDTKADRDQCEPNARPPQPSEVGVVSSLSLAQPQRHQLLGGLDGSGAGLHLGTGQGELSGGRTVRTNAVCVLRLPASVSLTQSATCSASRQQVND
jgi:hypothetical protein